MTRSLIAADVALAFNTANTRKSWSARPNARDTSEVVHFNAPTNLVTIIYDCRGDRFEVRFNKFHATWGDYTKSIARSLYVILSTLKAGGLPFECPEGDTLEGMEIITTVSDTAATFVRWPKDNPAA